MFTKDENVYFLFDIYRELKLRCRDPRRPQVQTADNGDEENNWKIGRQSN